MAFVRINSPREFSKVGKAIKKETERLVKKTDKKWSKDARPIAKDLVKKAIKAGYSPVAGGGGQTGGGSRFKEYSESYKDVIAGKVSFRTIKKRVVPMKQLAEDKAKFAGKRPSPVNMTLSGDMLNSLVSRVWKGSKGFTLWFTSPIANYHNDEGIKSNAGNIIRRLLPLNGKREELSETITNKLDALYLKIFNKIK